jgi:hypothetical protein
MAAQNPHLFVRDISPSAVEIPPPTPVTQSLYRRLCLMRVTIDHHDVRKGFLLRRTFYAVDLTVAFSHEEKAIIGIRRLKDTKLLDRRPATAAVDDRDEQFELRLRDLMDGRTDRFLCATPSKAKIYEEDLVRVMAQVKLWISDNATSGERRVVEL